MLTNNKPLAQHILDTTKAGYFSGNTMTLEDEEQIRKHVEFEILSIYKEVTLESDRSQFRLPKDFLEGVNGAISVEMFPKQPLKQQVAKQFAKDLAKAWQSYIQRAPVLKALIEYQNSLRDDQMFNFAEVDPSEITHMVNEQYPRED